MLGPDSWAGHLLGGAVLTSWDDTSILRPARIRSSCAAAVHSVHVWGIESNGLHELVDLNIVQCVQSGSCILLQHASLPSSSEQDE